MIYYSIPYSTNKNIGEYYNSVMEGLKNDDDFACFVDGDTIFTTPNFGDQIKDVVGRYPECGLFTCYTNRVGCDLQVYHGVDRNNNDMEYHRQIGRLLQDTYWDLCDDLSNPPKGTLISGMMILIRKSLWKKLGGFKSGMLSVDNDIHLKCIQAKEPVYLMKGVYIYHWYRWPDYKNISHLKGNSRYTPPEYVLGTNNRKVVYTCIFGNYDELKDPEVLNPNWDYICFTDQNLISKKWDVRKIPSDCVSEDVRKVQRKIKILAHRYLKNYDTSIWLDGNIQMLIDPDEFLSRYSHNSFSMIAHPERICLYDELDACERLGKDTNSSMNVLRDKLASEKYPHNNGMVQTGVLIRNHLDDSINGFCEVWWNHVMKYSHRDQTVFNYVLWKYPNIVKKIHLFSAKVLWSDLAFFNHKTKNNGSKKSDPGKMFGTLNNYLNGKLAFDGEKLIPTRTIRR